jgi:hypothetical protein
MLNLFGRSTTERAKSIAIGLLAALLVISLWQLWTATSQASHNDRNRQVATDLARQFAIALTTFDYAHEDVQRLSIAALSTPVVQRRVGRALPDLVALRASSHGDVRDSVVSSLTSTKAVVIVSTNQLFTSRNNLTATRLQGLLEVRLSQSPQSWVVTDYRWLEAPVDAP